MKAKLSYKSKRNIVITVVILALIAAISTATYFFLEGSDDTTAAFTEKNSQLGEVNQNDVQGENAQNTENQEPSDGTQQNDGEGVENNEENSSTTTTNQNEATTNNNSSSTTNNGTTTGTTGDVPNQDYVTERVEEQEFLVSENYEVEWAPLTIKATTTTAGLNIIRPIISAEKATNNTNVVEGEEIEYTITVVNNGNIEGKAIVKDAAPEKTTFKDGSVKINGVQKVNSEGRLYSEEDLKNGIELIVEAGAEITVSFTVTVNEDAEGTVTNTATVNEKETNIVKNPILKTEKISEVYRNDEKVDVAKVGDTIKYIIKVKNTSKDMDIETSIKDAAPEGTTLVEDSISNDGFLDEEDGTILWDKIILEKEEEYQVEFSVTVNKDRTTSVENIAIVDDMPTNNVENPVINVEALKESKADEPLYEKGIIEYKITLTNKGNAEGKVTVTDNVPEGTTLIPDSILIDGETAENITFEKDKNNLITWKDVTVGTEVDVVLSFKVTVNVFETDTKDIVNNTATLDNEPINETTDVALKVFIEVEGKKVWEDKNNANSKRPTDGITVQLKANGSVKQSQKVTGTGNEWSYKFSKLAKYDNNGDEIEYTVDEVTVDGYAKNISNYTITNSLPNIKVEKSVYNLNNVLGTTVSVKANDIVGYKIVVTNTGDVTLTNVVVTDTMANGNTANNNKIYLNYQDAVNETNGTNTVATIAELAENDVQTYIVYYKVKAADVADSNVKLNNKVEAVGHFVNGNGDDETIKDDSSATVSISKVPKITAAKTRVGSGNVEPGSTITYNITIKNEGNTNLNNVKVFDTMNNNPSGGSRAVTITGLTVAGSSKKIPTKGSDGSYNIGSLAIGQTAIITAKYVVQEKDMAETAKTITNTAKAEALSDGNEKVESKESKVDVTTIVWKSDIKLSKSSQLIKANPSSKVGTTTAEYGDKIKYTITAKNTGRKQGTVAVKDYIPEGCRLITFNASNGTTNLNQSEYTSLGNATENNKFSKTLTVPGNGGTVSIYFTVEVTAKPGTKVQNIATDGRNNSNVPESGHNVEKVVTVGTKNTTQTIENSNVLIIFDMSSSMTSKTMYDSTTGTYRTRHNIAYDTLNLQIMDHIAMKEDGTGSAVSVIGFWGIQSGSTSGLDYSHIVPVYNNSTDTIANTTAERWNMQSVMFPQYLSYTNPGTIISGALQRAITQMQVMKAANPNNRNIVIFIGDGNPEGDAAEDQIPTLAAQLKTEADAVYAIGFGENVSTLENTIATAATETQRYYTTITTTSDIIPTFSNIIEGEKLADTVEKVTSGGKITLTNINTAKNVTITINGGTPITDSLANLVTAGYIISENNEYKVNLGGSKFGANDSVEIVYFVNN